MFGFTGVLALGVLGLAVVVAVALVVRARRRRRAYDTTVDEIVDPLTTAFWGGGEWPRIVVRSHGRLREVSSRPRPVEVVPLASLAPWEPPRAS
jgi:hypothetical protein